MRLINFYTTFSFIFCVLLLSSCANYNMHLGPDIQDLPIVEGPTDTIEHTMYLIGDAGDATEDYANSATKMLKKHLDEASENSSVVFLGDNIYPVGMPPRSVRYNRKRAESHLDAQLDVLENFKGRPLFIPGNHDWYRYGVKGVNRQEDYIEGKINKGLDKDDDNYVNAFLPDNACSGPEIIDLNDKLSIVVIDSQWWLGDWNKIENINDGCEISDRETFAKEFRDVIRKNRNKNIVIALHHPIYTNGIHGGNYTVKNHIFPLTSFSKNFYLPLPVIGSIFQFLRGSIGSRQDLNNSFYKKMLDDLVEPAEEYGEFIFASGHEHSLQYIVEDDQHYIVSGAGSKQGPTRPASGTNFSYGRRGFSKLEFYKDGSTWLEFWVPSLEDEKGKMVFKQLIKGPLKDIHEDTPAEFPEYNDPSPTITAKPITYEVNPVGKFHTFMLGNHYRKVYMEEYEFKKLDLTTYQGGVEVVRRGGGMQTNSLRLEDKTGKQYVMRSLTKDVTRGIPHPFNQLSIVTFLFKDNYLATQPFAPLVIPTLAKASNVYHANSEIYYIPKQPVMGGYNLDFGGEVYITEERPDDDWRDADFFGNSKKIISTPDIAIKTQRSEKHVIDQNWVARSRIFDVVIGDWDRHDDQWRWARIDLEDDEYLYRPIPRDRDQAFSKYDGNLVRFLRPWSHFLKQLQDYTEEWTDMKWGIYNTRHFDHYFLNELSLEEWKKEGAFIRDNLTDEIIDEAFTKLPIKVFNLTAEETKKVLRSRRDNAVQIAEEMYLQLAKKVAVVGTDDEDLFEVIRQDDEHTLVNVYDISKKDKKKKYYSRVFKNSETKEIFLYGLEKDDEFYVSGEVDKSIVVRLIGGLDEDLFVDESKVTGLGKRTKIYDDTKEENEYKLGPESANRTSTNARRNAYNRRGNQFDANSFLPIPILGYNNNDDFLIGFSNTIKLNGFQKYPYAQSHKVSIDYASATSGVRFDYSGEFVEVANQLDFVVNTELRSSRNTFNYFGIGNETQRTTEDLDYNRVSQSSAFLDFGLQKRFNSSDGRISFRPLISITNIHNTDSTFIGSAESELIPDAFERKYYSGLVGGIYVDSKNDQVNPKNGVVFRTEMSWQANLESIESNFFKFGASFTLYHTFDRDRRLTLATKIGSETISGEYEFFQAPTIGRDNNIRGLLPQRYRGNTTFGHLTDLRFEFLQAKDSPLPLNMGLFGSFDYGRVWERQVKSGLWHYSYGGGIWISPLKLIVLSVGYHISDDDEQFVFQAQHSF